MTCEHWAQHTSAHTHKQSHTRTDKEQRSVRMCFVCSSGAHAMCHHHYHRFLSRLKPDNSLASWVWVCVCLTNEIIDKDYDKRQIMESNACSRIDRILTDKFCVFAQRPKQHRQQKRSWCHQKQQDKFQNCLCTLCVLVCRLSLMTFEWVRCR